MKIAPQHQQPLNIAIGNSTPGQGARAEMLYRKAFDLFHGKDVGEGPWQPQRLVITATPKIETVLATVTDNDTGLFIQMTGTLDKKTGTALTGPNMVYGKKYLEESRSPQLANNGIRIWR